MGIDGSDIKKKQEVKKKAQKTSNVTSKLFIFFIVIAITVSIAYIATNHKTTKTPPSIQQTETEKTAAVEPPPVMTEEPKPLLVLRDKTPEEIKSACTRQWPQNDVLARKCTKRNLEIRAQDLENEIIQREYALRQELYSMVEEHEKNCKKLYKYGSPQHKQCMAEAREQRQKLDAQAGQ